jgi:valyl-tRNA synthetase
MLAGLAGVVAASTEAFERFDYARALEMAESSFWTWTDDYLELVKARAYDDGEPARSAHAALQKSLSVYLRLFAPFLPFVTEEVWSWWREGSVHRSAWPSSEELGIFDGDPRVLTETSRVLAGVRKAKSDAKASMRAEVEVVTVTGSSEELELIRLSEDDLMAASRAEKIVYLDGEFEVTPVLAGASS